MTTSHTRPETTHPTQDQSHACTPGTGDDPIFDVIANTDPVVAICGCRDRAGRLLAHLVERELWEAIEGRCIGCDRQYVELCPRLRAFDT